MVWTQVLHWVAFLVAMNIVVLSDVQRLLTAPGTGLALLMLLALGTFVAGIHIAWQICILGIIMATCCPCDRMADIICSLFDLSRRSAHRDCRDVLWSHSDAGTPKVPARSE